MIWAYLALLGRVLMLGYERIVVKQLGTNSDSVGAAFLFFSLATIFLLPTLFFVPLPEDWGFMLWVILAAAIYSNTFVLYVRSLSLGEASLVGPLYNFNVFFLLILTSVFLKESFTILKFAGIFLLFYGTSFLNRQTNPVKSLKALFSDRACQLMILCSFLMAFGRTIDGYAVQTVSPIFYSFALYFMISLFLLSYILLKRRWKFTVELLKSKPVPSSVAAFINAYSYLLLVIAFTRIDVSIAEPASMLSMIVTVILAHFIFREKIKDRIVGVIIMIMGAWLLTSG
jgi:transporter family protein